MSVMNCEACEALGTKKQGDYMDAIYHSHGGSSYLRLCYNHSLELFRYGQTFFIEKYRPEVKSPSGVRNRDRLSNYFVFNAER